VINLAGFEYKPQYETNQIDINENDDDISIETMENSHNVSTPKINTSMNNNIEESVTTSPDATVTPDETESSNLQQGK